MITNEEMWKYRYMDNVKIVDKDNNVHIGTVITILDGDEYFGVDELKLETDKGIETFTANDISEISIVSEKMTYLEDYYNNYDEEGRLLSKHGQVEYITTQKYIHDCIRDISAKKILEIGSGTGRYSIALAREGFDVTAVELFEHNINQLKGKLEGTEIITVLQGNALDLSVLDDDSFDITLLLGPMYHLYSKQEKLKALSEAVRVTRQGGYILVAYCMNEPTVIQYVFGKNKLSEVLDCHMLTDDWHCISEPKDLFEMIRTEEIEALDREMAVERIKLVAADGATNYMRALIDSMDDQTFDKWVEYHLAVCERQDLIGASHHTLDILKKI